MDEEEEESRETNEELSSFEFNKFLAAAAPCRMWKGREKRRRQIYEYRARAKERKREREKDLQMDTRRESQIYCDILRVETVKILDGKDTQTNFCARKK